MYRSGTGFELRKGEKVGIKWKVRTVHDDECFEARWKLGNMLTKMFKSKGPPFERIVMSFMSVFEPFLYDQVVEKWEVKYTMNRLYSDKKTFRYYKQAIYATDRTF